MLSSVFQARLFRLHVGMWIEECLPTYVQADAGKSGEKQAGHLSTSSL